MQLRAKKDSLPPEPEADEDAVVTILVRMPDGRRQGRRFRKFDTLQVLNVVNIALNLSIHLCLVARRIGSFIDLPTDVMAIFAERYCCW